MCVGPFSFPSFLFFASRGLFAMDFFDEMNLFGPITPSCPILLREEI